MAKPHIKLIAGKDYKGDRIALYGIYRRRDALFPWTASATIAGLRRKLVQYPLPAPGNILQTVNDL